MKTFELVHNKEYGMKGQPSESATYKYQDGKRFWFRGTNGSFWMNEAQVETLLKEEPIYKTPGNWTTEHKPDGSMIITMDKGISIYIQYGIASVYKHTELATETEVGYMSLHQFNLYLHSINDNTFNYN